MVGARTTKPAGTEVPHVTNRASQQFRETWGGEGSYTPSLSSTQDDKTVTQHTRSGTILQAVSTGVQSTVITMPTDALLRIKLKNKQEQK